MRQSRAAGHIRSSGARPGLAGWVILLVALTVGPVDPTSADTSTAPPTFFIEKIHVETERLSPEIVLSESLLREGREYNELELKEAVHRIHRLPFVLLAEFSLGKGSERGRYELEIKIYETRRWFFQIGSNWLLRDEIDRFDPRVEGIFEERIGETVDDARGLVGRRFAIGKRGLLFASFGAEEGAFALGYQHFNLFDRNMLLSLTVGGLEEIGNVMVGESSWRATAQLGIPIKGNHALRILAGYSHYDARFLYFDGKLESRDSEAEVVWVYNSLDDPVLPRQGVLMEGGLTWSDVEDARFGIDEDGQLLLHQIDERRNGIIVAAQRHWPLARRQSVSLGARGFFEDGEGLNRIWEAEGKIGHQVFLMRNQEAGKWRELRLETRLAWLRQDFSRESGIPGLLQWVDSWSARTGLVYRNGWGLYRLTVEYVDREIQ